MLTILRTLPMVRAAVFALFFVALIVVPARAETSAHRSHHPAASAKTTHHRTHHRRVVRHRTARATHRPVRHRARRLARSRHTAHRSASRSRRLRAQSRTSHAVRPQSSPSPTPPAPAPQLDPPATSPAAEAVSFRAVRIVPTPPLRGSAASLERQNERTQADGLERILNNEDLNDRITRGFLVPVPTSNALTINTRLPQNHRYCRPWTADFLTDLAHAHEAEFHTSLQVSSAVRTIDYQKRLIRTNGNAASAVGEIVSPHVTGATIDITKKGMSTREIYWMRIELRALQNAGKIDVEEEFRQACFHITVYKSYLTRPELRQARRHELTTEAGEDSAS